MEVYAETRRGLWVALIIGLPMTLLFLVGVVLFLTDHPTPGDIFKAALTLLGGVIVGWLVVACIRLLRHQDPYLRVDDHGIECARGGFAWGDIRDVVDVTEKESRSLIFVLEEGTTPQPVARTYSDGQFMVVGPRLIQFGLELHYLKAASTALTAHGHAPVKATRKELVDNHEIELRSP